MNERSLHRGDRRTKQMRTATHRCMWPSQMAMLHLLNSCCGTHQMLRHRTHWERQPSTLLAGVCCFAWLCFFLVPFVVCTARSLFHTTLHWLGNTAAFMIDRV